jgi:hypothetical protein
MDSDFNHGRSFDGRFNTHCGAAPLGTKARAGEATGCVAADVAVLGALAAGVSAGAAGAGVAASVLADTCAAIGAGSSARLDAIAARAAAIAMTMSDFCMIVVFK